MIALVDYGAGNLTSVCKAFHHLGVEIAITHDPAVVARADSVVVPGVGHYAATAAIGPNLRTAILDAIARRVPYLGICLGMQLLFEASEEADTPGLGIIRGTCARLSGPVKVPHVGWNTLALVRPSRLLRGVASGAHAYFSHSYAAPLTAETVAVAEHGVPFAAVVQKEDHIAGVQFHPEKSGDVGLTMLRNFCGV